MMNTSSRLEIQPDRYAIIVGPRFAAQVVKETLDIPAGEGVRLPTFEFSAIMDHGVAFLLDGETLTSDAERSKFEARYKNAYELDPAFVLRKIVSSIKTAGRYEEWLSELFACDYQPRVASRSVQRLLALQHQGALLVYVHCDDILARAAGLQPVLMENEEQMDRWARGECAGFLHLHGVYSKPSSVQLDCQLYDNTSHPLYATAERLKQVLSTRDTILLGDDWEQLSSDPLLTNFCKRFVSDSAAGRHSFVFCAADNSPDLPGLPVCVCAAAPFPTVSPLTESSVDLWKQIHVATASKSESSEHQVLCLLVSNQAGAREISHMMFNAPGVNFALVNPATYSGCTVFGVSIRVESGSLRRLWHWLFSSQDTLLACGLLGFALHGGTFLWLRDPTTSARHGSVVHSPLSKGSLAANVENTIENSYATLANGCSPDTNNHQNNVLSPAPLTSVSAPSSPPRTVGGGEVRHNKIIQRYKVVKKRNQIKNSTPADMYPYTGHLMTNACEDVSMVLPPSPYSMYARRGSLPPIKTGEMGNALALLAERLQQTTDTGPSQVPSYVAIKRALLSDKFKHTQNPISRMVVPKALLNLLQSKKLTVDLSQRPNLLAHRRNSDPGSYLQHRDKTRRRQLFLDENRLWIKTYGSVIEKRIQGWKQKRLQRLQREYFYAQHELAACHKQNGFRVLSSLNSSPQLVASPLHSALASSTITSSSIPSSLQQAFLTAANGSSVNSFSPAHLMYQLCNTTVTPTPMLLSTHPFISPYTLMGSYATLPVTAASVQPTAAYIVPPSVLAAAAGAQQKVVFLPSTSSVPVNTSSSGTTARLPMVSVSSFPDTKPPFSSLLAPASTLPVASHTKPEPQTRSCHPPPPLTPASESASSKKRKNTFPEKLSSLLQPLSEADPDSPPAVKRICSVSQPTVTLENTGHVSAFRSSTSSPPSYSNHHTSHSHHHHLEHSVSSSQSHHEHHHYSHHSNSTHSHHHHSHHSTSDHHHYHRHPHRSHHSPSPPSHTSPSPLEQCLLQPPASPQSDSRAPDSPGGSPYLFSPPSPTNCSAQNQPQLWQFLLELLLTANCSHLIEWTNGGREYEFTIRDPAQVALLWGKYSNNSAMNYDKLARGLRYYYAKGIIVKVEGKKLTFRYNGLAKSYVQRRCGLAVDVTGSIEEMVVVE